MKEHYYDGHDLEALANLQNYQNWIVEQFAPYLTGETVEYGAGVGNVSALLEPLVSSLHLVEPSANLAPRLYERFAGRANVTIHSASLESHAAQLQEASIDGIVLVNVLEHIEDDAGALSGMARILKPGGHVMLFVPALNFLMSPMDQRLQHKRRYLRKGLERLVSGVGLEVVSSRYMDLLGVAAWFFVHRVGRSTEFNPPMAQLYDRLFVPATRAIESLGASWLGKSISLVARKSPATRNK
jgi:SAM-dependent methyltransferase